jgi:hypothetical protein
LVLASGKTGSPLRQCERRPAAEKHVRQLRSWSAANRETTAAVRDLPIRSGIKVVTIQSCMRVASGNALAPAAVSASPASTVGPGSGRPSVDTDILKLGIAELAQRGTASARLRSVFLPTGIS